MICKPEWVFAFGIAILPACAASQPRPAGTSAPEKTDEVIETSQSGQAGQASVVPLDHVRNIVLVHGAFVDGSGWKPVYEILLHRGYNVDVVQEPLTSLENDVAAVKRVLDLAPGPRILVAHSYGGTVITQAGDDPRVAGLVYIAAHEPDTGETEAANAKRMPGAGKPPLKTRDGFLYLDPAAFPHEFAADLPREQAEFEARSQMLTAASVFTTRVTAAAWKVKPSWALVAGGDRIINPNLERMYAERAHSQVVEVPGASHSVYESHPVEVVALIEEAARAAAK